MRMRVSFLSNIDYTDTQLSLNAKILNNVVEQKSNFIIR